MRWTATEVLERVFRAPATVPSLAVACGTRPSWVARLVDGLAARGLVEPVAGPDEPVRPADTAAADSYRSLTEGHDPRRLVAHGRERLLHALRGGPRSVAHPRRYRPASRVLESAIADLLAADAVAVSDGEVTVDDDALERFLDVCPPRTPAGTSAATLSDPDLTGPAKVDGDDERANGRAAPTPADGSTEVGLTDGDVRAALRRLDDRLDESVTTYLTGGAALTLHGVRDRTADLDLGFVDRDGMRAVVTALDAETVRSPPFDAPAHVPRTDAYDPRTRPLAVRVTDDRGLVWDLFDRTVAHVLDLTPGVCRRAAVSLDLGRLTVQALAPSDLLVGKLLDRRVGATVDAARLVRVADPDWDAVAEAVCRQETSTGLAATLAARTAITRLAVLTDRCPPTNRFDRLADRRAVRHAADDVRARTVEEVATLLGRPVDSIEEAVERLVADGQVTRRADGRITDAD